MAFQTLILDKRKFIYYTISKYDYRVRYMKDPYKKLKIINTFKKYARLGLASGRLDAIDTYGRIIGYSRSKKEAKELIAVYETVRFLSICKKDDALDALFAVYFSLSGKGVRKSEISERVLRFATESFCDQRTVYRRLSYVVSVYEQLLEK